MSGTDVTVVGATLCLSALAHLLLMLMQWTLSNSADYAQRLHHLHMFVHSQEKFIFTF